MPQIKLLRNVGTELGNALGIEPKTLRTEYVEGKTINAPAKVADVLIEKKLAVAPGAPEVAPEVEPEEVSSVADLKPVDAIDTISRMRSPELLQAIIDSEGGRPKVQQAAVERLAAIKK